jgi:outer membrane protein assembly factor BamD
MLRTVYYSISLALLVVLGAGCDSYKKIRKSDDLDLKYQKAKEYYNEEKWDKAIPLFEELINVYKGQKDISELYYYFAYSHFGKENYLLAGYHFRKIARTYSKSQYAEECLFMYAYCYYLLSPRHSLDQKYTYKAIDAFQLFVNKYPNSDRVKRCNNYIDDLRRKLKRKAFESAKLYHEVGYYKAATVALENVLDEYPDITYKERINFLILDAQYRLAKNSVKEKKTRRYRQTLQEYNAFVEQFPSSEYQDEAEKIHRKTTQYLNQ